MHESHEKYLLPSVLQCYEFHSILRKLYAGELLKTL